MTNCFDPAAASSVAAWHYVGEGRGGFSKVQSYSYAGIGHGDWERKVTTTYTGWRLKNWCIVLLAVLLLVPLMYLLSPLLLTEDTSEARKPHKVLVQAPPELPFDCDDDQGWVDEKKAWCCEHFKMHCPSTTEGVLRATPLIVSGRGKELAVKQTTTPRPVQSHQMPPPKGPNTQQQTLPPFDCDIDYADCYHCLQKSWAPAKRDWCCEHGGRGCTTPAPPFDCGKGSTGDWLSDKRDYCCAHGGRGCTTTALPAEVARAAARAKRARRAERAERASREAAAAAAERAESPPPGSLPFDCDAGFAHWAHGWSVPKKAWCCDHARRGCPSLTTSLPFDCNAGFGEWRHGWSIPKKAWCCQHVGRGCPDGTSLPFDCDADFTSCYHCLQRRWSTAKRQWCCQHRGRGCTTTSIPFDCNAALNNWKRAWSPGKIQWCCKNQGKGC